MFEIALRTSFCYCDARFGTDMGAFVRAYRAILLTLIIVAPLMAYVPRHILTPSGMALERWSDSTFPIVWRLSSALGSNVTGTRSVADVVRAAFAAWSNEAAARISFSEGATTTVRDAALDGVNLVSVSPSTYDSTTLSRTIVYSFVAQGTDALGRAIEFPGQIVEADILLNPTVLFTTSTAGAAGRFDLQSRVTHEIGHLLGLDHSGLLSAIMFPNLDSGRIGQRSLSRDDIIGISTLYPLGTFFSSTGALTGIVRAPNGAAVFGAHVVVVNALGEPVAGTIADGGGEYKVRGLDAGTYSAYAEPIDGPVAGADIPSLEAVSSGQVPRTDFTTRFAVSAAPSTVLSLVKIGGDNQTGDIGAVLAAPLEVEVRNAQGQPVQGARVIFAASSGGGAVVPISVSADTAGRARTTGYLGAGGTQTFTASASASAVTFSGTVRVPTFTAITPNIGSAGSTVTVTLAGSNFQRGATNIVVSGAGIAVSNIDVQSPASLRATFTIDASASTGARDIIVTTPSGSTVIRTFTIGTLTTPQVGLMEFNTIAIFGNGTETLTFSAQISGSPATVRAEFFTNGAAAANCPLMYRGDSIGPFTLFDDGTHGDAMAGDSVFTLSGLTANCSASVGGFARLTASNSAGTVT
ncbi:MAG: matrixin family metalloprotease, partial [Acidobacteria bacterium]|nr:matrixin family metalloprotease [Acidobacteriota bacterium]